MKKMTLSQVKKLADEIDKLMVKHVGEKHGLTVDFNKIKYDEHGFYGQLSFKIAGEEAEAAQFAELAPMYHMKASDYKRQVVIEGKTFSILGFETSRRAYGIVAVNVKTGKKTNLRTTAVQEIFARER